MIRHSKVFDERVGQFGAVIVCDPGGSALHISHQAVQVNAGMRNADHADGGTIPELCRVEFSDRHVKTRSQAIFETTNNLSAIL